MNTCLTCKWAEPMPAMNGAEASGACRLNPPMPSIVMTPKGPAPMVMVPTVRLTKDYCSHYAVQLVKPAMGSELRLEK